MPVSLRLFVPLFLLLLTSCSSMLSHDFHTSAPQSTAHVDAELESLTVLEAPSDERTGLTFLVTNEVIREWHIGLEDAVIQSVIFTGNPNRRLSLTVSILRLTTPLAGFSVTAHSDARYELVDAATGTTLYTKSIDTMGYVPFDYAYLGVVRANEAVNCGVRNNIKAFLADLQAAIAENPLLPPSRLQPASITPRS